MSSQKGGRSLEPGDPLHTRLMGDLRQRLESKEWEAGAQLPTEHVLSKEYDVSRSTVRTALKLLEAQGLLRTRQGAGTFVTPYGAQARSGLQDLRSTTQTLREQGFDPSVKCHLVERRICSPDFAEAFALPDDTAVVYLEREILASGESVAFAYEEVRADLVTIPLEPDRFSTSLFEVLRETAGVQHAYATTDISAVDDVSIGGVRAPEGKSLYLLMKQAHFTKSGQPTVYSRNYFVEGKFRFSVMRLA